MSRRSGVTAEDFIRAWQASDSLVEVAEKLNTDKHLAYSRANYYRRRGVPLKKFPSMQCLNWQPLIALAASLEPGAAEGAEE